MSLAACHVSISKPDVKGLLPSHGLSVWPEMKHSTVQEFSNSILFPTCTFISITKYVIMTYFKKYSLVPIFTASGQIFVLGKLMAVLS